MHPYVSLNNKTIKSSDAGVAVDSEAFRYGSGVFTTIRIDEGKPVLWDSHFQRLSGSAESIGIDFSWTRKDLREALDSVIAANEVQSARARISVLGAGGLFVGYNPKGTQFLVETSNLPDRPLEYRLGVSDYLVNTRSPTVGLKTLNYLNHLLAFRVAKSEGMGEAVRLNEKGKIVSGCLSNIFWMSSGRIFTPAVSTGCLKGTTRGEIVDKTIVEEVEDGIDALENAEAIFLTSAVIGIRPVKWFRGSAVKSTEIPEALQEIRGLFPVT